MSSVRTVNNHQPRVVNAAAAPVRVMHPNSEEAPHKALARTMISAWAALVRVMGEAKAQQFRDYLRARGLDILPIEYGLRVAISGLELTTGGRPVADVAVFLDRLGVIAIKRVRINRDPAGRWGAMWPNGKEYLEDGSVRWHPASSMSGVLSRHVVHAILEAAIDIGMLPVTERGRVSRRYNPDGGGQRLTVALEEAIAAPAGETA